MALVGANKQVALKWSSPDENHFQTTLTHFWAGFERAWFSLPPSFSHTKYTGFWKRRTRTHFWAGFQQKPLLWTFGHNCLDVFEGVSSPSEPGMMCWLMSESDGWPLCVLFITSMTKMLHWNYSCILCLSCVTDCNLQWKWKRVVKLLVSKHFTVKVSDQTLCVWAPPR